MQVAVTCHPESFDELPFGALSFVRQLSNDPYRHARHLSGWRREVVQLGSGAFSGVVTEAGGGGLYAADELMSRGLFHIGSAYRDGLTLGAILPHGSDGVLWNGQRVAGDTVFCVADGSEMVFRSYENCRVQWLFVPWAMLDCSTQFRECIRQQGDAAALSIHDEFLATRLRRCIAVVCRWSSSAVSSPKLAADAFVLSQEKVLAIARQFIADYLVRIPVLGTREVHAMRILRATRAYLRENIGEMVGIADLCAAASTSERTLRNACELVTGESPMSFLRAMRLNQVRRSILAARSSVRITEIGMRWGFLHMPQFSKDYRALFGELPSETVRRQLDGVQGISA
jgi:AraC family ethanolamine operon transcriptional activator